MNAVIFAYKRCLQALAVIQTAYTCKQHFKSKSACSCVVALMFNSISRTIVLRVALQCSCACFQSPALLSFASKLFTQLLHTLTVTLSYQYHFSGFRAVMRPNFTVFILKPRTISSIAKAPLIVLGPLLIKPIIPLPVSDVRITAGQKYCYIKNSYSTGSYTVVSVTV
jgi:hypothetical protein